MANKKSEQVEETEVVSEVSHVTVNLGIDPNDPRKFPPVDGASVPIVDINEPQ